MSNDGYGKNPYGLSPYGFSGGVLISPPHPVSEGYGGSEYGFSPYGGNGFGTKPVAPVDGGYGGSPYGHGPYGSIGTNSPTVTSAVSLTGFKIEVFFSMEMFIDAALVDAASYLLTVLLGAPATSLSVVTGILGPLGGASSIIITHTGTTLGGQYVITVNGPKGINGSPISGSYPQNQVTLLTKGEPPPYTITPISGSELLFTFDQDMLSESEFTPGIEEFSAYQFTSTFPVPLVITGITHPFLGDASKMVMDVNGMTSASYTCDVSPADAIIYEGNELPSDSTQFLGTELGTGTSIVGASGLLLSKQPGTFYGWAFRDLTSKILPGSSYRADVTIDATQAVYNPALFDATLATIEVTDGAVQFTISLLRIGGVDNIRVQSGLFVDLFLSTWSSEVTTITVARNQKANFFTILVNESPKTTVVTGTPNGPSTFPAGAQVIIDPAGVYEVTQLPLKSVLFTSTQTVFSAAWNFLHGQESVFTGSTDLTRGNFVTNCGPLTKGWGDSTPATKDDVTVFVNDTEIEVESVNPYTGQIFTVIPIPLMPMGAITVTTDYFCFPGAVFPLAGLNTDGLVLNKTGSGGDSIFNFTAVLGPFSNFENVRAQPLQLGHRFIGYERDYSALFNSPTTLLLNEDPHQTSRKLLQDIPPSDSVSLVFESQNTPLNSEPAWELLGEDTGEALALSPLYILRDSSAGSFNVGEPTVYSRTLELSFPSSIVISAWFWVDPDKVTYDGVFTGVGFGVHDNFNLYLVGTLLINGVQHVGILKNPGKHREEKSWELANNVSIEILDATTFRMQTSDLPVLSTSFVQSGNLIRFQIFEGSQSGIYDIVEIIEQTDGTATITIDSVLPFPEDPKLWDNRDANAVFETRWDGTGQTKELTIYRLVVKSDNILNPKGSAQLFVGSSIVGSALDINGDVDLASPTDETLMLPTNDQGTAFFGSLSRIATNESTWSFVRYGVVPDQTRSSAQGVIVSSDFTVLPQNDPDYEWFESQKFGQSVIDSTDTRMLLKSTSAANQPGVTTSDLTFGYVRIEPFLTRSINFDVDVVFQVDSGTQGARDLDIDVFDTNRLVRLSTLLYVEDATEPLPQNFRKLLDLPSISLSGLQTPELQGWQLIDPGFDGAIEARSEGQISIFTQVPKTRIRYQHSFDVSKLVDDGRIIEARLQFTDTSTTDTSGETLIFFGANVGPVVLPRSVALKFRTAEGANPARVVLFSPSSGLEVGVFDFAWEDGDYHDYRLLVAPSTDTVTLMVDDSLVGVSTYGDFDAATDNVIVELGFAGDLTTATVRLDALSVSNTPPATAKRTLGVWLGGDEKDITKWQIPRTDTSSVPNSFPGAVVEEMDWRDETKVRIHRDPAWGVTIIRPDLPPPPYFTGNFATEITQPSAGWINVEYAWLPRDTSTFGGIRFGSLNPQSISQQRWKSLDYRVYPQSSENFIPLQHSVLNQYNVVTSGELNFDISVEKYVIESKTSSTVSILPISITADRVFNLLYDDLEGNPIIVNPDFFDFDRDAQLVTLRSGLLQDAGMPPVFPSENTPVTVSFAAGKPVSKTYLENEPFENSQTLLNEGTPPIQKSQVGAEVREIVPGEVLTDPRNLPGIDPGTIDNTPYSTVEWNGLPKDLYDCMDFFEVSNGGETGLLSTLCDSPGPGEGSGWNEIEISGTLFTESGFAIHDGPTGQVGGQPASCLLETSGGGHVGTRINECILRPAFAGGAPAIGAGGSVNWPVIGRLYNPVTLEIEIVYFTR